MHSATIRQHFRVSSGPGAAPWSRLADVDSNRPLPPPWAIAGGVVAALALIFALGYIYGEQPDWRVAEWHWGNILTVTVASVAIIASVWVSRVTLNRNAAQFEQTRLDSRNDKLKEEVASLLSALSERSDRQTIFVKRLYDAERDVRAARGDPERADPDAHAAASKRFGQEVRAVFSEQISPVYETAMSHAFAIFLLTNELTLIEPLIRIQTALKAEKRDFEKSLSISDRLAAGESVTPDEFKAEAQRGRDAQAQFEQQLFAASVDLMLNAIKLFSPLGPAFAAVDFASVFAAARGDASEGSDDG
ncbi:hypothetical protein ACRUZW_26060 [Mycobacterium colombiense]